MNKERTIVYVNFDPYINAGHILEYLLDHFKNVLVFAFNFHSLGKKQKKSKLQIYKHGRLQKEFTLFQLKADVPISLIFLFLPLRSIILLIQVVYYLLILKKHYTRYDIFFTVNAFTAWTGNILKKFNLVEKTIYWVWDYYPPFHSNKIVVLMRWIYWQLDKKSSISDKIVYLNQRLIDLRKKIGVWKEGINYTIVPIGTNPIPNIKINPTKHLNIAFIGVLKQSQGLDIFFDNQKLLIKKFPNLRLHIIGSGPDEQYFKQKAMFSTLSTRFYGYTPNEKDVNKILSICAIGVAPYKPEENNVSYFGDPSKIKMYLSRSIPVITTNVFLFYSEIKKHKAGIIINYQKPLELVEGLEKILFDYKKYQKNALSLAKKYKYTKIYPEIFKL